MPQGICLVNFNIRRQNGLDPMAKKKKKRKAAPALSGKVMAHWGLPEGIIKYPLEKKEKLE